LYIEHHDYRPTPEWIDELVERLSYFTILALITSASGVVKTPFVNAKEIKD
jgi:hypothetical protein